MKPIEIKKSDYFNYTGKQLDLEFMKGQSDDGTSGADKFLKNISIDTWDFLRARYFFDEEDFANDCLLDTNIITRYKRALCHQAEYILENGDKQVNASLVGVSTIAPKAKEIFRMLGLMNIQPARDMYRRF